MCALRDKTPRVRSNARPNKGRYPVCLQLFCRTGAFPVMKFHDSVQVPVDYFLKIPYTDLAVNKGKTCREAER